MKKDTIYFASDFHLGIPNINESHERERHIVNWLDEIKKDAKSIYLLGDIFDFWFEYNKVVPKGFVRLLGKLAELNDNGTDLHLVVGNHDLWMFEYLKEEIGVHIHHEAFIIKEQNKKIFIGHGDGLGNGDYIYKFLKKLFTSSICQFLFARLHPNFAISLAQRWSKNSRYKKETKFTTKENELLYNFCKHHQLKNKMDYYIFGHRHLPLELKIDNKSTYFNVGEWLTQYSYAKLSNGKLSLKYHK